VATALSVNLNKVALLRNQRDVGYPSVVAAAQTCIAAGADGITVHPRPDERHIRVQDVHDLAAAIDVEFNIEGNPEPDFLALVETIRPAQCTLVPDSPDQRTSDHGWDVDADGARLRPIIGRLHDLGVRVALFMDPAPEQMAAVAALGTDRVELYTESYASAFGGAQQEDILQQFVRTAAAAEAAGLGINAGHDLSADNLPLFVSSVANVLEVSIGHALIADALWQGLDKTVRSYKQALAI
jgi:pyridoxine 5-phosphate synthase